MGYSVSWIATKGRRKDDVLAALDVIETGRPDPEARGRLSYASLPNGWLVIYSNRFNYASPQVISKLSEGAIAIGCSVEEHVMFSGIRAFRDGREAWSVVHDAQDGIYHLSTSGELPEAFGPIRTRLFREQDDAGGADAVVDFIFEIPIELAAALTGFRHDEAMPKDGGPALVELRSSRPGLLETIFGSR
jgi:hypothetical protein